MMRWVAGCASAVALVLAFVFFWKSRALAHDPVPPAPIAAAAYATPTAQAGGQAALPPEASARSREEKRFARADKNKDGRVILAELLEPRRKAFDKLDADHNGQLSFQEWTVKTQSKFGEADADHNGILNAFEYASTAPAKKPKPVRCAC
ncbi:MAG: hypothetical protein QOG13_1637 [Sphingomonadales bacterium]|jgi:hypothetical protein|nr:hypothetical protein [Sphingomonadales bacterium]